MRSSQNIDTQENNISLRRSVDKKKIRINKKNIVNSSLEDKFDNIVDFYNFTKMSVSHKKRKSRLYTESAYSDISAKSAHLSIRGSIEKLKKIDKSKSKSVKKPKKNKNKKKIKVKKKKKSKKNKKIKKRGKSEIPPEIPVEMLVIEKEENKIIKNQPKRRKYHSHRSYSVKRNKSKFLFNNIQQNYK